MERNMRRVVYGVGGVVLAILAVAFAVLLGKSSNPPVVIVGGCIRVQHSNQPWNPPSSGKPLYLASTNDTTQIFPTSVLLNGTLLSGPLNPAPANGWKIEIYDPHSIQSSVNTPGVTICSNQTCDGIGDKRTVYVTPRGDNHTGFESAVNNTELRFHTTFSGCDADFSGSENPNCDHISSIKFYACGPNGQCANPVQWDCGSANSQDQAQGTCTIQIGPSSSAK